MAAAGTDALVGGDQVVAVYIALGHPREVWRFRGAGVLHARPSRGSVREKCDGTTATIFVEIVSCYCGPSLKHKVEVGVVGRVVPAEASDHPRRDIRPRVRSCPHRMARSSRATLPIGDCRRASEAAISFLDSVPVRAEAAVRNGGIGAVPEIHRDCVGQAVGFEHDHVQRALFVQFVQLVVSEGNRLRRVGSTCTFQRIDRARSGAARIRVSQQD